MGLFYQLFIFSSFYVFFFCIQVPRKRGNPILRYPGERIHTQRGIPTALPSGIMMRSERCAALNSPQLTNKMVIPYVASSPQWMWFEILLRANNPDQKLWGTWPALRCYMRLVIKSGDFFYTQIQVIFVWAGATSSWSRCWLTGWCPLVWGGP